MTAQFLPTVPRRRGGHSRPSRVRVEPAVDTGAMKGSYGDTAYFEAHPQLCRHYRRVHSEATLADGKTKVLVTKSVLVTLDIILIAGGHVRADIWVDLMPMASRHFIVGAPEIIAFYGDVVREHLDFHRAYFRESYERYQGGRGPVHHVALVDGVDDLDTHTRTSRIR